MRTSCIAVLAALVVSGLGTPVAAAGVKPPPGFSASYNTALAQAKKENKPLYLHFTTDWCGWCRKIEQDVYANAKGKTALAAFVPVSLDCSDNAPGSKANQAVMAKFTDRKAYPYLIIIAPDGAVLKMWSGYVEVDAFTKRLAEAKETFDKYNEFLEKAQTADPKDLAFQVEAMDYYLSMQQWDKAEQAAKKVIELDKDREHLGQAKITQLKVAKAKKNAQAITSLTAEIRKLDPENAKQHLEDALAEQAKVFMLQATNQTREAQYKKALAVLVERTKLANLRDPEQTTMDVANLQVDCGKFKDARITLEKLLMNHPDSPKASTYKDSIERYKKAGY